jgi:hypothetical protein
MRTAMFMVKGVLAEALDKSLPACSPISDGVMLYHAIRPSHDIIVTGHSGADSWNEIAFWCSRERVEYADIFVGDVDRSIAHARSVGRPVQLFVSADPRDVQRAWELGVPSLLFVAPAYGRPEWRPDAPTSPRAWDELVEETMEGVFAKAGDPRLDVSEAAQVAARYEGEDIDGD